MKKKQQIIKPETQDTGKNAKQQLEEIRADLKTQVDNLKQSISRIQQESLKSLQFNHAALKEEESKHRLEAELNSLDPNGSSESAPAHPENPMLDTSKYSEAAIKITQASIEDALKSAQASLEAAENLLKHRDLSK